MQLAAIVADPSLKPQSLPAPEAGGPQVAGSGAASADPTTYFDVVTQVSNSPSDVGGLSSDKYLGFVGEIGVDALQGVNEWMAEQIVLGFEMYQQFNAGLGQGVLNIINGVQDSVIELVNFGMYPQLQMLGIGEIKSPDWSYGWITHEDKALHDWSKFIGGESAIELITFGAGKIRHVSKLARLPPLAAGH